MKKKQRCLLKRFSALVAALMLCASLCVPCFASNNAQWRKWVITGEANLQTESGSTGKYFCLTPFENGQKYAAVFQTQMSHVQRVNSTLYDWWMVPVNYPDWWRSALPLGAYSYLYISSVRVVDWHDTAGQSKPTSVTFIPLNTSFGLSLTRSLYSSAASVSSPLFAYPYSIEIRSNSGDSATDVQPIGFTHSVGSASSSYDRLQNASQVVFTAVNFYDATSASTNTDWGLNFNQQNTFYNISSDELAFAVVASSKLKPFDPQTINLTVSAVLEFWIDANKLPSGLQVGDEFPADTDAFDQLRDDLIKQFPEASENIENGKATIQGWNDTETVDTDVASTSISALNALFQNLGGFLFIVSLMVFGAVVLRMLIRKAVDG